METVPAYDPLDPFPMYQYMRATSPVFSISESGVWQVFRYDDAVQVLNNPAVFSSEVYGHATEEAPMGESIVYIDPPRHRQLRSLVNLAFTPKRVAQMETRIAEIAQELLERVSAAGSMDFIEDFTSPLPVTVIAELLGIPPEERANFRRWSDDLLKASYEGVAYNQPDLYNYVRSVIQERHKAPMDDLISVLIKAEVDGQSLNERELLDFCVLLLVAGNETTMNLLGNALLCFDEHPGALEELQQDISLMPSAIEEVLRYRSPAQLMGRIARVDTVLGGQHIRAGELVTVHVGSVNRDESQFDNPDTFDIRRTPNRHLAFGHGIHFCLGAPLARLETRIGLSLLLERFTDIQLTKTAPWEPVLPIFYGVKHLPMTFRERERNK